MFLCTLTNLLEQLKLKDKMAATIATPYHYYPFGSTLLTMEDYMAGISCPLLDAEEMLLQQRGAREVSCCSNICRIAK